MMIKKGMTPFLFIGFLLTAYLNLSVIAVALIGVCLAAHLHGLQVQRFPCSRRCRFHYDPLEDDEAKEERTMATATKDVSLNKKVSQFFWRSWAIQASWNYSVR